MDSINGGAYELEFETNLLRTGGLRARVFVELLRKRAKLGHSYFKRCDHGIFARFCQFLSGCGCAASLVVPSFPC